MTQTFSGTHPFRPQCLIDALTEALSDEHAGDEESAREDAVERMPALLELSENGKCLRCGTAFVAGEIPSGARETGCRCIPICSVCSEAEALAWAAVEEIKGPADAVLLELVSPVSDWPVSPSSTAEAVAVFRDRYTRHVEVITGELIGGPPIGGWAQFGYDDSTDIDEKTGR